MQVFWVLGEMIGIVLRLVLYFEELIKYFLKGYYKRNINLGVVRNIKERRELCLFISFKEFFLVQNIR